MSTTPREDPGSRGEEELQTFYTAAEHIEEDSDLLINGLLGIATADGDKYAVDCTFSQRFSPDDFGTVLGTLLGTHAVQHSWTPQQISGFLLRVVSNRGMAQSAPVERRKVDWPEEQEDAEDPA